MGQKCQSQFVFAAPVFLSKIRILCFEQIVLFIDFKQLLPMFLIVLLDLSTTQIGIKMNW